MPRWNPVRGVCQLLGLWALLAGTFVLARMLSGHLASGAWAPSAEFWGLTAGISLAQLVVLRLFAMFPAGRWIKGRFDAS